MTKQPRRAKGLADIKIGAARWRTIPYGKLPIDRTIAELRRRGMILEGLSPLDVRQSIATAGHFARMAAEHYLLAVPEVRDLSKKRLQAIAQMQASLCDIAADLSDGQLAIVAGGDPRDLNAGMQADEEFAFVGKMERDLRRAKATFDRLAEIYRAGSAWAIPSNADPLASLFVENMRTAWAKITGQQRKSPRLLVELAAEAWQMFDFPRHSDLQGWLARKFKTA